MENAAGLHENDRLARLSSRQCRLIGGGRLTQAVVTTQRRCDVSGSLLKPALRPGADSVVVSHARSASSLTHDVTIASTLSDVTIRHFSPAVIIRRRSRRKTSHGPRRGNDGVQTRYSKAPFTSSTSSRVWRVRSLLATNQQPHCYSCIFITIRQGWWIVHQSG